MPDISMCKGKDCPLKETCYRYTAESSDYQSYFTEVPFENDKCEFYWGPDADSIWNQLTEILKPNQDDEHTDI